MAPLPADASSPARSRRAPQRRPTWALGEKRLSLASEDLPRVSAGPLSRVHPLEGERT